MAADLLYYTVHYGGSIKMQIYITCPIRGRVNDNRDELNPLQLQIYMQITVQEDLIMEEQRLGFSLSGIRDRSVHWKRTGRSPHRSSTTTTNDDH